jgi:hypothetical protein
MRKKGGACANCLPIPEFVFLTLFKEPPELALGPTVACFSL